MTTTCSCYEQFWSVHTCLSWNCIHVYPATVHFTVDIWQRSKVLLLCTFIISA